MKLNGRGSTGDIKTLEFDGRGSAGDIKSWESNMNGGTMGSK